MESSRRNKRFTHHFHPDPGFHQANDSKSAVSDHTDVNFVCFGMAPPICSTRPDADNDHTRYVFYSNFIIFVQIDLRF